MPNFLYLTSIRKWRADLKAPQDISVAGIDNLEISLHTTPALTTVHLPAAKLGEEPANYLLARLQSRERPKRVSLPIELVISGSASAL